MELRRELAHERCDLSGRFWEPEPPDNLEAEEVMDQSDPEELPFI